MTTWLEHAREMLKLPSMMQPLDETFEEIKEKYNAQKTFSSVDCTGPGHGKVATRNERWFISKSPERRHLNFERRKAPCDSGFFAPKGIPYKPYGNLKTLSALDLVEDSLSISISRPYKYNRATSRPHHKHAIRGYDEEEHANTILVHDVQKRKRDLPPAPTAGLDIISKELGSNSRTLTDVRAGNSLQDAIHREAHRKVVLKVIKAPKVIFQKGHPMIIHKPCVYLPPMLPTASSKICLLNMPTKAMINPGGDGEEEVTNRIKKMTRPIDGKGDDEHEIKALMKRNFFAKVKCIYALLCCLHNIKSKELRRYKPLNFSTIKHLSRRPFNLSSACMEPHHLYTASLVTQHHLNLVQNHYHASILSSRKKGPKVSFDEWEDILYHHEENMYLSTPESNPPGQVTRRLKRTLPPWKRKVIVDDQETWKRDAATKLDINIKAVQRFKSEMGQKVRLALQEKEQLRERTRTLYLKHLSCKAGKEKNLMEMRSRTYQVRWAERKKDLETPEWFVLLEEEVKAIFAEEGLEHQGNAALEGLKQFMYVGTDALPLVVEKLCLIAMSLPAHYLCIQQIVLAFQFVSEFFVKTSPKLIEQLRKIRQLPNVIELHPPDYLFGMHIKSVFY